MELCGVRTFLPLKNKERWDTINLKDYRKEMIESFNDEYIKVMDRIPTGVMPEEEEAIKLALLRSKQKNNMLFSKFTTEDNGVVKPLLICGFEPLFKEVRGVETTLYVAKYMHDRLTMYKVSYVVAKDVPNITDVMSFYFTEELMEHFLNKTGYLKNHLERSDAQ